MRAETVGMARRGGLTGRAGERTELASSETREETQNWLMKLFPGMPKEGI